MPYKALEEQMPKRVEPREYFESDTPSLWTIVFVGAGVVVFGGEQLRVYALICVMRA